ncbi:MAG: metallophosphoesterase [Treponemataceae bacterium]|nr:metallophosphoesterase [Treponemataceae bacterium]
MKILCVSDQIDPLIYNQNARKNFPDIDLILCAGDLPMDYIDFIVTTFNKPTYFIFGNHNLTEFKYYHGSRTGPGTADPGGALIEAGKFDMEKEVGHQHGAIYAGFRILKNPALKVNGGRRGKQSPLLLAGISGSRKYNNGQNQYSEREMKFRLLCMVPRLLLNHVLYGRYLDILLTHASPRHIHDHEDPCHVGFECFNWFLRRFRPAYMVHGHIHLYDQRDERIGKYGDTTVVNAFAHCVIQFPIK